MKTPGIIRAKFHIVVSHPQPSEHPSARAGLLSEQEACAIANAIEPQFKMYSAMYDTKKYWPDVYQRACQEFRQPDQVTAETLRDALLWKYGHLGKKNIPSAHELLISDLQKGWGEAMAALPSAPPEAFLALDRGFGGKTRFITVAFLVHLLHPGQVPIIDQHNFRAVNALMRGVRPTWRIRQKPSRYADIELVAAFMRSVLKAWRRNAPETAPPHRELDKFLMMYGKALKGRPNKRFTQKENIPARRQFD